MPEDPPTKTVEPSSLRPLVAIVFAALSCYAVLAVVLVISATNAGAEALIWLAIPASLAAAAAAALVIGSRTELREKLAAMSAIFVVDLPDQRARRQTTPPARGRV